MSRRVRNYCKLEPKEVKADEQNSKSKIITNAWDKPYQSHVKRDNNQVTIIEERYANSRVALRSTVEQKRNAYRSKMVEDLQNICLDWDPVGNSGEPNLEDIWKPRGRLVAHVHQHSAAINQVALNANNSMMVTASDDASIRIWNTEQFSLGCPKNIFQKF